MNINDNDKITKTMEDNQKKKEQTAYISIIGNVIITIVKFIAFSYTQSIVVLAEAWHSSTDILTSLMVYFALKKDYKKFDKKPTSDGYIQDLMNASYEIKSSIIIGCFIFMVGFSLLMRAFFEELEIIRYPLGSGLFFLLFSLLSLVIYRFETNAGKRLESPGLVSDGMHSRSDAITSLFAGISLILYNYGINTERFAASLISIIIVGFGMEVVINSFRAIYRKENIFDLKINQILFLLFAPEFWMGIDKRLNINLSAFIYSNRRRFLYTAGTVIMLIYLSTSFFVVGISQRAVVERFGKPLDNVYDSGLHIKLPYPFDKVRKVDSKAVKKIDIGNIVRQDSFALLWTKEHGADQPFISGDNNLFYPYISVYYSITDVEDYLYSSQIPVEIFSDISQAVITEFFSRYSFFDIATYKRSEIPSIIGNKIQNASDMLNLGIRVTDITIKDVHPPIPIAHYFEDVIAAIQDKEMMINRSLAFRNEQIPGARSDAVIALEQAKAYASERKNISQGISVNFKMRVEGFHKYPGIMRTFLMLDMISRVYPGKKIFIVDEDLPMPDIWNTNKAFIRSDFITEAEKQPAVAGQNTITPEERRFIER